MRAIYYNLQNLQTRLAGMSDDQIKALWGRVDEHGKRISDLTITQQVQAHQITSQEQRFDRFIGEQEKTRAEILEAVRGHHKREGVKEFARLVLPWVLAGAALLMWIIPVVAK